MRRYPRHQVEHLVKKGKWSDEPVQYAVVEIDASRSLSNPEVKIHRSAGFDKSLQINDIEKAKELLATITFAYEGYFEDEFELSEDLTKAETESKTVYIICNKSIERVEDIENVSYRENFHIELEDDQKYFDVYKGEPVFYVSGKRFDDDYWY